MLPFGRDPLNSPLSVISSTSSRALQQFAAQADPGADLATPQPGDLITAELFNALQARLDLLDQKVGPGIQLGQLGTAISTLVALGSGTDANGGIWLDGQPLLVGDPVQGINLVVLDGTLTVRFRRAYNTFSDPAASAALVSDLKVPPLMPGDIVVAITHDQFTTLLSPEARTALASIGGAALAAASPNRDNGAFIGVVPSISQNLSFNYLSSLIPADRLGGIAALSFVWGVYSRPLRRFILGAGASGVPPTGVIPGSVAGVASVVFNPSPVTRPNNVSATITINNPAPPGGATIRLESSDTQLASVPVSVTIAEGQTSASFTVGVLRAGSVTIRATQGNTTPVASTLVIQEPVGLVSVVLASRTILRPGNLSATVTVAPAAPVPVIVLLSSDNPQSAFVQPSVTVQQGQTTAQFTVATTISAGTANIRATLPGSTTVLQDTLTVTEPVTVANIALAQTTVVRPNNTTATVNLTGTVPAGGTTITLASTNPAVASVPQTITIPQGSTSSTVTVRCVGGGTTDLVASLPGSPPVRATLTVQEGVAVRAISLDPNPVEAGRSVNGGVTLTNVAPAGGVNVNLSSSNAQVANVPGSVQIPENTNTASFTISTNAGGSSDIGGAVAGQATPVAQSLVVQAKTKDAKDAKDSKEAADAKTQQDNKNQVDQKNATDQKNAQDNKNNQDQKNTKDNRDKSVEDKADRDSGGKLIAIDRKTVREQPQLRPQIVEAEPFNPRLIPGGINALEEVQVDGTGRSFIQASERPSVGQQALDATAAAATDGSA